MSNILLTGGTGSLGKKILELGLFQNIVAPDRFEMDITDAISVQNFFDANKIKTVIHCAALARMGICEADPAKAINVNVNGTSNIVSSILASNKNCKMIFISTDGVYQSTTGDYSEDSPTIPYNIYGFTKLAGELISKSVPNHLIIRTRFFDKDSIMYRDSATDIFTSSIEINELVNIIFKLHIQDFKGVINVGSNPESDYIKYSRHKSDLKKCLRKDIVKNLDYEIAINSTLNLQKLKRFLNND